MPPNDCLETIGECKWKTPRSQAPCVLTASRENKKLMCGGPTVPIHPIVPSFRQNTKASPEEVVEVEAGPGDASNAYHESMLTAVQLTFNSSNRQTAAKLSKEPSSSSTWAICRQQWCWKSDVKPTVMSCSKFAHLSIERCVSCKVLVFGSWKISCVSLDLEESDCLCTTHCRLPKKTSNLTSIDGVHWRGHGTNADANHAANICAVGYGAPRYDS